MASKATPNDIPMLVPGSGVEYIRDLDFVIQPGQVDALEHNLHLQNVLRLLPMINGLGGFTKAAQAGHEASFREYYGDRLPEVALSVRAKRDRLVRQAEESFNAAYGVDEMVIGGLTTVRKAQAMARAEYHDYKWKFGQPGQRREREMELVRLIRSEMILGKNRIAGIRQPEQTLSPERPKPFLSQLTEHEKLMALDGDPEGGFLPASRRELWRAMTFLDYKDKPGDYPDGTMHQLDEVFIRQQRGYARHDLGEDGKPVRRNATYGNQEGIKAMLSLGFEMGDYYLNALQSINSLRELQASLMDISPTISLAEALGSEHPSIPYVLRYVDQSYIREHGAKPAGLKMDAFRSHRNEDRVEPDKRKNKTIEDAYTGDFKTKVASERILKGARTVTVAEARKAIGPALANESARARFWEKCLHEAINRRFIARAANIVLEYVRN